MEERSGWRGALATAWGNLTGISNEGNIRTFRWLFFLLLVAGTGWAVWNYMQGIKIMAVETAVPAGAANAAELDKQRLDGMIQSVVGTSNIRQNSMDAAGRMEMYLARYPFDPPKSEADMIVVPEEVFVVEAPPPVVVIDYPPEGITLRGIMTMGRDNVAVMDIPGVGTGMVVRAGDTFMRRKGRIVRIAPDKVVISWGGKNWDIAPSF